MLKRILMATLALIVFVGGIAFLQKTARASVLPLGTQWVLPNDEVMLLHSDYAIRADDFGTNAWLNVPDDAKASFSVKAASSKSWSAYPNVFRGDEWGIDTQGGWPVKVADDGMPQSTLDIAQNWHGRYDAAYDLWFNKTSYGNGMADGAEIMIWLSHPGVTPHSVVKWAWIDGAEWEITSWRIGNASTGRNYVAFIREHQTSSVHGLWLNEFFRVAESMGKLSRNWYWTAAEAGFELDGGGAGSGLGVKYFQVSA